MNQWETLSNSMAEDLMGWQLKNGMLVLSITTFSSTQAATGR